MTVYLDSLRAGHSYLELTPAGEDDGEVYGFYPAKFDEKREVLFGEGMIREDRERLTSCKQNSDIEQTAKSFVLNEQEFQRALDFVRKQQEEPNYYFIVGYNCIDFIQDAYDAAKDGKGEPFLERYTKEELEVLSWVGTYANLHKLPS